MSQFEPEEEGDALPEKVSALEFSLRRQQRQDRFSKKYGLEITDFVDIFKISTAEITIIPPVVEEVAEPEPEPVVEAPKKKGKKGAEAPPPPPPQAVEEEKELEPLIFQLSFILKGWLNTV